MPIQPVGNADINNCSGCSLKNFSVFKNCPETILDSLFANKSIRNFKKKEKIIYQNDPFKGVFCIQQGIVKISKEGNNKNDFILWIARPGDIIGLDSFINNEDYSFSATAVGDVCTCFIPASDFKDILAKGHEVSIGLMKDLCNKITFIEYRITSISRKKIKEQFAEILLSLSASDKKCSDGKSRLDFSVKDIANLIGTTKNYLYRILSELAEEKVVSVENKKIVINDLSRLSLIAIGDKSLC